jgi:hypothetical protein
LFYKNFTENHEVFQIYARTAFGDAYGEYLPLISRAKQQADIRISNSIVTTPIAT